VILEAGASSFASDWTSVQQQVARTNPVGSYDRAGSGGSEPRQNVETPASVVEDLHSLLHAAGLKPPNVLVGASMGGIYIRLYQLQYPDEVLCMVLVDPASENRMFTMVNGKGVPNFRFPRSS
jgi:pimeloyl-ACP methyl ester carboxylesterase